MMKKLLILLLFIGCSVVGFGQQDSMFTIEGTVWDEETGEPMKDATVFIIENNVKLDSIKLYDNGKYEFEISRKGCYNLSSKSDNYNEQFSDKCYLFEKGKTQQHDFFLSFQKYFEVPLFNTIPIQVFVNDEQGSLIPNTQLIVFYENEDTTVYNIKNGTITIEYNRGKKLTLEVSKEGFLISKEKYFKYVNSSGCIPYFVTKVELDKIIAEEQIIKTYQKIYIILIQEE